MKAKRAQRTVAGVLFITLLLCTVYALIRFLLTSDAPPGDPHSKLKSDYLLMLVQCCLGLVVMTLPTVFSRKLRLMVPGVMCILYYVFLYAAIILGEILSFYHLLHGIWDSVLHAFSAAMLATLGFILVDWMNKESHIKLSMNPAFVALFAEALADGAVECGLPRDKAMNYALQTIAGTAEYLMETGTHPAVLKDAVCSPGGSTIAGVHAMELGGFRAAAAEAVICAYEKTLELGK